PAAGPSRSLPPPPTRRSSDLRVEPLRTRLVLASGAVLAFVAVGEELAWGTRLAGRGIVAVESRNVQGDTTLHNLEGAKELSRVADRKSTRLNSSHVKNSHAGL